jgi:hypothetical protein
MIPIGYKSIAILRCGPAYTGTFLHLECVSLLFLLDFTSTLFSESFDFLAQYNNQNEFLQWCNRIVKGLLDISRLQPAGV